MNATASDIEILQEAVQHNEVILTHDNDFGTLLAFSGQNKPSVILFRIHKISAERFFYLLADNWLTLEHALEKGAFIVIEEDKLRIRSLPIKR